MPDLGELRCGTEGQRGSLRRHDTDPDAASADPASPRFRKPLEQAGAKGLERQNGQSQVHAGLGCRSARLSERLGNLQVEAGVVGGNKYLGTCIAESDGPQGFVVIHPPESAPR